MYFLQQCAAAWIQARRFNQIFCQADRIVGEKGKKVRDVCKAVTVRVTMNYQSGKEGNTDKEGIKKSVNVIG